MYHDEIFDHRSADPPSDDLILDLDDPVQSTTVAEAVARRPARITVRLERIPARLDPTHRELLWQVALRAHLLTVPTRCALARVLASGVVHPASIAVVPLTSRAHAHPSSHDPFEGPGPLVMTPATCHPGESFDEVLDAVAGLADHGVAVRYVAVPDLTGATPGNDERAELRFLAAVDDRGICDRARWCRDDPVAVMSAAQVVVLPWSDDDLVASQALVDALNLAVPVLATAFPHAVEAAATGAVHLVRPRSKASLERGLHRLVTRPLLRTAMRHAARAHRVVPADPPTRSRLAPAQASTSAV